MNDNYDFYVGFIVGLVSAAVLAAFVAVTSYRGLQRQAIERGFAEYSQTTGEWQWKEGE